MATIEAMPSLSQDTLRGYVLEEILAKLIQNTGYRLLVDAEQDRDELENRANGLAVRGRGGAHQVDVLGELAWIPAFTFPLRLIVEAKARGRKSGIDDVRNAVGVVSDVNQNFTRSSATRSALLQKFAYRYALFSAAGFTAPAAEYALAHQISLIDLSAQDFVDLLQLAQRVTTILWGDEPPRRTDGFVRGLRTRMRMALDTWPADIYPGERNAGSAEFAERWLRVEETVVAGVEAIGELFVGMANGPYLLLLRAPDPRQAVDLLDRQPVQDVAIHWSRGVQNGTRWNVTSVDPANPLQLSFALPEPVAAWVFDEDADARRRALQFKEQFLSTITIYRYVDDRDRLYRLRFSREQVAESWQARRRSPNRSR
jgi:hypothetical protein